MNESPNLCRRAVCASLAGAALCGSAIAAGEKYPSRPIKLVVPFAAGGGNDVVARLVADQLAPLLGQPIVIENRVGAGGNIGTDFVAKSSPDGYTLVHVANTVVMNPYLYKKLPFDVQKDLQPVALLATAPIFILTRSDSGIQSLSDLIQRGKEAKIRLSYATPGNGTPQHFAMELLKASSGLDIQHVPYKGAAPAVTDVLGGHVPVLVSTPSSVTDFIASGKLRLLATMDATRSDAYPNVPTVAERVPNLHVSIWHGLMMPAGVPADVLQTVSSSVKRVLDEPAVQKKLAAVGFQAKYESPQLMKTRIAAELATWKSVAAKAGIVAE